MRIGRLAALTGESTRTIRFYESIDVLAKPTRTGSGHRDYEVEAIAELNTIRTLQAGGLSLSEIADIVALSRDPHRFAELLHLIAINQAKIDTRISTCQRVRTELQDILRRSNPHGRPAAGNTRPGCRPR